MWIPWSWLTDPWERWTQSPGERMGASRHNGVWHCLQSSAVGALPFSSWFYFLEAAFSKRLSCGSPGGSSATPAWRGCANPMGNLALSYPTVSSLAWTALELQLLVVGEDCRHTGRVPLVSSRLGQCPAIFSCQRIPVSNIHKHTIYIIFFLVFSARLACSTILCL